MQPRNPKKSPNAERLWCGLQEWCGGGGGGRGVFLSLDIQTHPEKTFGPPKPT